MPCHAPAERRFQPAPGTRVLVAWGPEFPDRGRPVAELFDAEQLHLPSSSHLDLVIDDDTRRAILRAWLGRGAR